MNNSIKNNPLPKEKLDFFRVNGRSSTKYTECAWCNSVLTKGRDFLGDGQCDKCFIEMSEKMKP